MKHVSGINEAYDAMKQNLSFGGSEEENRSMTPNTLKRTRFKVIEPKEFRLSFQRE